MSLRILPSAIEVAREFFALAKDANDTDFTTYKLQKLLSYAQSWSQHERGNNLFLEQVKAWEDGPVVPDVYSKLKGLKYIPFTNELLSEQNTLSDEDKMFVHAVWQLYGHLTGDQLSAKSHEQKSYQSARARAHIFRNSPPIEAEDTRAEIAELIEKKSSEFAAFVDGLSS